MLRSSRLAQLVQDLANKGRRNDAIRELVGGINATDLRKVGTLPEETLAALMAGVADPHPKVRWWCIQLLDHVADERALSAVATALDDPVDHVRRNAAHALGCVTCKPTADRDLPAGLLGKLTQLSEHDPSRKVRDEAARALACRGG